MKKLKLISMLMAAACGLVCAAAQGASPVPGQQVEQKFQTADLAEVPYLLYLPDDYESGKDPWPLMLFLHGRGESDGPLSLVTKWGPPRMAARGDHLPYILVSPQCPTDDSWRNPSQQSRLVELLDSIIEKYDVDEDRIYLTGLSMGGSGSWRLAADHPDRFAAVVPICGRGDPHDVHKLKDLPVWVFIGDQDRGFQQSLKMVAAIREAGSERVRLTTLENIGHNSWSAAYATPSLYAWLDRQTRAEK